MTTDPGPATTGTYAPYCDDTTDIPGAGISRCNMAAGHPGEHSSGLASWTNLLAAVDAAHRNATNRGPAAADHTLTPADTDDVYRMPDAVLLEAARLHWPYNQQHLDQYAPSLRKAVEHVWRAAVDAARADLVAELAKLTIRVRVTDHLNDKLCTAVDTVNRLASREADTILLLMAEANDSADVVKWLRVALADCELLALDLAEQRDAARAALTDTQAQLAQARGTTDIAVTAIAYVHATPGDETQDCWYALKGAVDHYEAVARRVAASARAALRTESELRYELGQSDATAAYADGDTTGATP